MPSASAITIANKTDSSQLHAQRVRIVFMIHAHSNPLRSRPGAAAACTAGSITVSGTSLFVLCLRVPFFVSLAIFALDVSGGLLEPPNSKKIGR